MNDKQLDNIINLGGRPNKKNKYEIQRKEIVAKLNNIFGITDDNKQFCLYDLDNDLNKQQEILNLKDDIEKYFSCSTWTVFNSFSIIFIYPATFLMRTT